jgi:hypothetical protein
MSMSMARLATPGGAPPSRSHGLPEGSLMHCPNCGFENPGGTPLGGHRWQRLASGLHGRGPDHPPRRSYEADGPVRSMSLTAAGTAAYAAAVGWRGRCRGHAVTCVTMARHHTSTTKTPLSQCRQGSYHFDCGPLDEECADGAERQAGSIHSNSRSRTMLPGSRQALEGHSQDALDEPVV